MRIKLSYEKSTKIKQSVRHSFSIILDKVLEEDNEVIITNASLSPYAKGWSGYRPFVSCDAKHYERVDSDYNNGCFRFTMPKGSRYSCWFPEYKLEDLISFFASYHREFSFYNKIPYIHLGDKGKPCIVFIARQHPGETMGSFFLEGVFSTLFHSNLQFSQYSFLILPIVNISGVENNNHRVTIDGVDLNRIWNKSCSHIVDIKSILGKFSNIIALVDLHGDEVSKKNYILSSERDNRIFNTMFSNILYLPQQSWPKRFIKNLLRQKKITSPFKRNTAQNYFSKMGMPTMTLELSAHTTDPNSLRALGGQAIQQVLKDNVSEKAK